ncbi:MAG TPA: hypothetical protein VGQ83_15565 [Polyangia bacterium]
MFRRQIPCACLTVLLACAACSSPGSIDGDGGVGRACVVTGHNTPEKAIPLALGDTYPPVDADQDTCIYPTRMQLWFKVDLPADRPLLTVQVGFPPQARSKVNLQYQVFADPVDLQHPLGSGVDQDETPHASRLAGTHYITNPGTYYVMVHDAGDNAQDQYSTFAITLSAVQDPDPNEASGNNDCAHAIDIGTGQDGFIAYQGDRDAFKISVPAGAKIIDLTLDSKNQPSLVRYKAELYPPSGGTLLYEDSNPGAGVTAIHTRRAVVGAGGDYCVLVRDLDDTAADPKAGYHIAATIVDEPDTNETSARNDAPGAATNLGTGGTRTGFIASTGDADWYAVHQTAGQLIEVDAEGAPASTVRLGMTMVYPHDTSPCNAAANDSCAYLTGTDTCTLPTDCDSNVCQRGRCALFCDTNLDCPGAIGCSAHACAGAAVCLPEGQCGVLQYQKRPASTAPNAVHTQQPAFAATTYVAIYDTHNPPVYDASGSYTMTFTQHAEPDAGERDNFYNAFLAIENPEQDPGDVLARNKPFARALPMNTTVNGYISYEGDIDVWAFPNPCGTGDCGLQITYGKPAGSTSCTTLATGGPGDPLDIVFFGYSNNFDLKFSWHGCEEGSETVFGDGTCGSGDAECAFFWGQDSDNYYLMVRDWHHNKWDLTHPYSLSVSFSAGCPGADNGNGGCQRYQGTGNCYACQ